ncbi:MAG: SWIM zinc finger family protein [Deltaproteobacteria bacterium]|nr:SWIM zinc finger family protein [Deltaproteobacteria bacterium]
MGCAPGVHDVPAREARPILPLPTHDEILALAPDASSVAAARKATAARLWRGLGRSERALWGICAGSADYAVAVDLDGRVGRCPCPSRKIPCKHALALLLIAAEGRVPAAPAAPEAVTEWLDGRDSRAQAAKVRAEAKAERPVDTEAQAARRAQRLARVVAGAEGLERWLDDVVTSGLAALEAAGFAPFAREAARLVDAQAPGLARRVKALGGLPGAGPGWPDALLAGLGQLALLTHAVRRLDALPDDLAADVLDAVGFGARPEEVLAGGPRVRGRWQVVAVRQDTDDENLRWERAWLIEEASGREALILQFAFGARPFEHALQPGLAFDGELAFFPGRAPRRAALCERGLGAPLEGPPSGARPIAAVREQAARALAAVPWTEVVGVSVAGAVATVDDDGGGLLVDPATGDRLALAPSVDPWPLVALSGGHPLVVSGELAGDRLLPLGAFADGVYHVLSAAPEGAR